MGTFEWFEDDAAFNDGIARRFGLIGIDNRQGDDLLTTEVLFHIDNWDHPRDWKHIWEEIIFDVSPGGSIGMELHVPAGFLSDHQSFVDVLPDDYIVNDVAWKVWPNPEWEELVLKLHAEPGSYVLIDSIHFATECVPEPATLLLFGTGAAGLLGVLRRRRRG